MPFPWKKNRVTRISQIVADLQSPKRGGSLVVETGFPTSLIDLFVKNKSRFKKPKSKKPVRPEIPDPPPPPPSPATTPPPSLPDPPSPIVPLPEAPRLSPLVAENSDAVAVSGRVVACGGGSGMNMVVGVVVKVFVVVVLIANVKRLTVGITASAFALLFLEYAGKRVVSCLGPCSNANVAVESLAQRVCDCVWFQKLLQLKKNNCELAIVQGEILVGGNEFSKLGTGSLSIDEIEVVETKSECCEGTCFVVGSELDSLSGDMMKWGGPELLEDDYSMGIKVVGACGISECKTRGSRSGRFKSKMVKKLMPKKFRGSKKEKKEKGSKEGEVESGSEVSSALDEDKSHSFEIEEEPEDVAKEEKDNRIRPSLLLRTKLECVRDDEVDCGVTCSQELPLAKEEAAASNEQKRIDRVGNLSYTILLVIALAGLVVGRFPALILTMTWCFMLKIVKTLWRSQNVPLIKCSVPNS